MLRISNRDRDADQKIRLSQGLLYETRTMFDTIEFKVQTFSLLILKINDDRSQNKFATDFPYTH